MKILKTFTLIAFLSFSMITFGQSAHGLDFDGTDDYVNCGNDPSLNITGAVTVEAWIYITQTISQYKRFVEKDWATSYFLGSRFGTDGVAFSMDPNGNTSNVLETGDILSQFNWTHVAGTWDGSTLKIYVNGVEEASMPWSNTVDGSNNDVLIGKYYGGSSQNFDGSIDEVRIWSVARTEQEIRDNMYKELENPASIPNLVAYYQFNEGSGQTSADLSANSNTAVLGGTMSVESSDPTWITSTAPVPYASKTNGDWDNVFTWKNGQGYPFNSWAIVEINNNVVVDHNAVAGNVTINPSGSLTVNSGFSLNVDELFMIKSDATGTGSFIDNGTFTAASSTVERYFAEDDWHLISSPLSNGQAGIFTGMYLQQYTETTAAWSDVTNVNDPLNVMQGYALWIPTSTTYTAEFPGTLNTGNTSLGFTADNPFGWNLMGNPYPSSVDWDMVVPVPNMNAAVYYLDAASGNYVTYVGGVGASRYIPPMQGFWISATGSGTLSFDNNMRTHTGKDTYYKNQNDNMAVIVASGSGFEDNLYINFTEEATSGFDSNYDAWKLIGGYNPELPQLFTLVDDTKLSIDSRPQTASIDAGFYSGSSSEFTLSLGENAGFETVIVEDMLTGTMTDLMTENYTFSYNSGDDEDRFVFHFETVTGIDQSRASAFSVWSHNQSVYINSGLENQAKAFVYSITGQLIETSSLIQGINVLHLDQRGNYIVKVVGSSNVTSEKIFIK